MTGKALPVVESPGEEIVGSALIVGWPTVCEPGDDEGGPLDGATGIGTIGGFGVRGTEELGIVPALGELCMVAIDGFGGIGTG